LLFRKVTEGPFVDLDNLKLNERTMKSYRTKQNLTKNDIVLNFYDKNIQQKPLNKIDLDSFASNNLFVKNTKVEGVNTGLVNLKTFPEIKKLNMMRVSAHDMFTKELLSDYEVLLREGWSKNTGRIVKDHYNGDKKSETAFTDIPYGYYHLKIAKDGYDAQEILISFDRSGLVYPFYLKRSSVIGNAIVMNWVDGKQDFNLNLKLHNVKTGEKCSCNAENEFCPTAMFVRDRKQNEAGFEYVFTMPHKDWKMMAYAFVRPNSEKKATKKINLKSRNRTLMTAAQQEKINEKLRSSAANESRTKNGNRINVWFAKGEGTIKQIQDAKKAVLKTRKDWLKRDKNQMRTQVAIEKAELVSNKK